MRTLIFGAGGQLGRTLTRVFDPDNTVGLTHAEVDISDEPSVVAALVAHQPDVVINSAAWTDVDGCELDPDRAHLMNAVGPWWIARACQRTGSALVQLSTDYVFDGRGARGENGQPRAYTEFDAIAPVNEYGRSKAAGERLVRETLREHYIVRTAWLAAADGANFVTQVLEAGRSHGAVQVVDDQTGSPTYALDLAVAIRTLSSTGRYGTYHRTNRGSCSRFDLAAAALELAGLDVELTAISSEELDQPAPRPTYSALSNRHASACGLPPLAHWRDGLRRLVAEHDTP